jgi:segregation and condensation protein B
MAEINHIPKFVLLDRDQQKHFLETLIFSSEDRLTIKLLIDILSEKEDFFDKYNKEVDLDVKSGEESENAPSERSILPDDFDEAMLSRFALNQKYIKLLIDEINIDLEKTNRPFRIVDFAGGYQYSTLNEYGELVASVVKAKSKKRISNVQLETLAIIAYKQPVTKPEIEQIRGVNSKEAINSVVEKGFATVVGRSEKVGKPLLYGTTKDFLETFGLSSLKDLPNLKEINELTDDRPDEEELQKVKINPTTMDKEAINEQNYTNSETDAVLTKEDENAVKLSDDLVIEDSADQKVNTDSLSSLYIKNK